MTLSPSYHPTNSFFLSPPSLHLPPHPHPLPTALQVANFEVARLTSRLAQLERDQASLTSKTAVDLMAIRKEAEDRLAALEKEKRDA
jgi:hypothetical protein